MILTHRLHVLYNKGFQATYEYFVTYATQITHSLCNTFLYLCGGTVLPRGHIRETPYFIKMFNRDYTEIY
jgi:hypothetical protein